MHYVRQKITWSSSFYIVMAPDRNQCMFVCYQSGCRPVHGQGEGYGGRHHSHHEAGERAGRDQGVGHGTGSAGTLGHPGRQAGSADRGAPAGVTLRGWVGGA